MPVAPRDTFSISVFPDEPGGEELPPGNIGLPRTTTFGRIRHVARGAVSSPSFRTVGGWEARQSANGGYMAAAGRVSGKRLARPFSKINGGAEFRSYLDENDRILFAGIAKEPSLDGVWRVLQVDGHGTIPDRRPMNLFYADFDSYSDWHPAEGDPHHYADSDPNVHSGSDGMILFESTAGDVYATGDKACLVYAKPGQSITRVTGTFSQKPGAVDPEDFWETRLEASSFPTGVRNFVEIFDLSGADTYDFDVAMPGTEQIDFMMERTATGTSGGYWVHYTNLKIYGIAQAPTYTPSQAVRDVCSRLGISTEFVQESGGNILPMPSVLMTPRQVLDYAAMVMDWRWVIWDTGFGPVMDFGPWTTRRWRLLDPQKQFHPIALPRYRWVEAEYQWTSSITQTVRVASTDPTLPRENQDTYRIRTVMQNRDAALAACQQLIGYFSKPRQGGTARVFTVESAFGFEVPSGYVLAGDVVDVGGSELRLADHQISGEESQFTFQDDIHFEERVVSALLLGRTSTV